MKHSELRRQWTSAIEMTGVLPLTQENAFDLQSGGSLLNTRDGPRGTKSIERVTVTAWRKLFNKYWSPFVSVSFITTLQSNLSTAPTTYNNTQNNWNKCIISQAQNATAFQPNVFLTEIQRYLVTHTRGGRLSTVQTTVKVNWNLHSQQAKSGREGWAEVTSNRTHKLKGLFWFQAENL
jgi:hypothetical protein